MAGVEVGIDGRDERMTTDESGRFALSVPIGTYSLVAALPGFGSTRVDAVRVVADEVTPLEVVLQINVRAAESVVVSPGVVSLSRGTPVSVQVMTREQIDDLPVIAGDYPRAARLLPGITGADFSAQSNIRGGRPDEVLVLLDGLELIEPYHLRDFEDALTIVASDIVERTDIHSGGFPAWFGDRMSGVLDMTTVYPEADQRTTLSLSTLESGVASSGTLFGGRGGWLASGRLSTADWATDLVDIEEDPRFGDVFGKLAYRIADDQGLQLHWLQSADDFRHGETSEEGIEQRTRTDYQTYSGWLRHDALIGNDLSLESIAAIGRVSRDRGLTGESALGGGSVLDRRDLDWSSLSHRGTHLMSSRALIRWGGEVRRLDASYDYSSGEALGPAVDFRDRFHGNQIGLYLSGQLDLADRLTLEIGGRYDENEIVDDSHLSPRLSLACAVGSSSILRLSWGHYFQSQRAYELQVEDGERAFFPDELTEMGVASLDHAFAGGLELRLEAYAKEISDPRPRYENLFDPVSRFPEIEPDRVRIAPSRSRGYGAEILLRQRGERLDWMAGYAYSKIEDRIESGWVPRSYDQPHSVLLNATYRPGDRWTLGGSWTFHTGWPRTPVSIGTGPSGAPALEVGPLYGERFDDYSRLDLKVSRSWSLGSGELTLFAEVFNVLETQNVRGYDYDLESGEGGPTLSRDAELWLGTVPILGVEWAF